MKYTEIDFDGLARVGADTVDVTGYYGKMKHIFGLLGLTTTITLVVMTIDNPDWLLKSTAYYGNGYLWGDSYFGANSYASCLKGGYPGCDASTTPMEFAQIMFMRRPESRLQDLMILCFTLLPLILFATMRRPRPVRFNRELGAIYGWRRGRLFIHPSRYFTYTLNTAFDGLRMSNAYGEAILRLKDSRDPKRTAKFKVGPYPARQPGQPSRLLDQLKGFLQGGEAPDVHARRPDTIRYPWWQRSLLGPKRLPDDIDAIARDWMRQQELKA